jgi:hypothetical protein
MGQILLAGCPIGNFFPGGKNKNSHSVYAITAFRISEKPRENAKI